MLSSPHIDWLDHRFLALTRLAQRLLTLQPGHSLISPKLTLSVGSSISITLHAATQARRLLAFTAVGLPSSNENHPMDQSGHTECYAKPRRPGETPAICSYATFSASSRAGWTFATEWGKEAFKVAGYRIEFEVKLFHRRIHFMRRVGLLP